MRIEVNTERLGQAAEALGAQERQLKTASGEIGTAVSAALAALHGASDPGLGSALRRLQSAWTYDVEQIAADVSGLSGIMRSLAELYGEANTVPSDEGDE